ncbi:MAG: PAS domain S-box protein [Kangiellaceae bacterium]|jgi:PAS domain S-box-containing protein|nr:PAS domain S-box protein [Kangiellaceae bacterium]
MTSKKFHNSVNIRTISDINLSDQLPSDVKNDPLVKLLQYSVEVAADEVFWLDANGSTVYANAQACHKLGYKSNELIGMSVWQWDPLFPKETWPDIWQEIQSRKKIQFETKHKTKLGIEFPVEVKSYYYAIQDKEYALCFVTDITNKKSKELDSEKKAQAINVEKTELEIHLSELVENVPGAFFQYSIDQQGNDSLKYMSPGSLDIWELTPEEIGESPAVLWAMTNPDDLPEMAQSVQDSQNNLSRWVHEWRITTPSGKHKWLRGIGNPRKVEGNIFVWNSFIMDITELRKQQDTISRIQRLDTIGQLVAGISHDFNNLLAVIDGNRELLEFKNESPHAIKHLDNIASATERAKNLTAKLLRTSKRQLTPSARKSSLNIAINETKSLLEEITPANVLVCWDINLDIDTMVEGEELQDVINNLYVNALNAIEKDGRIHIETRQQSEFSVDSQSYTFLNPNQSDKYIKLTVKDNGCGIDRSHIDNIFTPFYSFSKNKTGTGLGLAMVAGFASRFGYGITIMSVVNKGTEFSLWIPVMPEMSNHEITDRHDTEEISTKKLRIVVIDDVIEVLDMVSDILELSGHNVIKFNDANQAVNWLQTNSDSIDMIISDVIMPGKVQGTKIYDEFNSRVPVLLMSGYSKLSDAQLARYDVLEKPFTSNSLLHSIDRVISGK